MKTVVTALMIATLSACASSTNDLMYKNCRDGGASVDECNARLSAYDSSYEEHADWGDIGSKVLAGVAVGAVVVGAAAAGANSTGTTQTLYKGNCEYSNDVASDGTSCGGRSAESRPGGYEPY